MGPSYNDYRDPLTIGLIPFPLPFSMAVHFPWPCKMRYIVGEHIAPACGPEAADNPELVRQCADHVGNALRNLLATS